MYRNHFLPECVGFNQSVQRHFSPECIVPRTTRGCHSPSLRLDSDEKRLIVALFCSHLPVKRCKGHDA